MKDIRIEQSLRVRYVQTNDFWFQWCCGCRLRHIWHLEVIRGETPEEDIIKLTGADDQIATRLRRFYDQANKKHKVKSR
jgi:hypothetical protein